MLKYRLFILTIDKTPSKLPWFLTPLVSEGILDHCVCGISLKAGDYIPEECQKDEFTYVPVFSNAAQCIQIHCTYIGELVFSAIVLKTFHKSK